MTLTLAPLEPLYIGKVLVSAPTRANEFRVIEEESGMRFSN